MKSIIDSLTIEQKEEVLNLGIRLGGIGHLLGHPIYALNKNSVWSEELRRDYCVKGGVVDQAKDFAQEVINQINAQYAGVPIAEEYKEHIQKRLVELEEAAKPYRS